MTWLMTIARNRAMDALRSTASDREYIVRPRISDDPFVDLYTKKILGK